MKKNTTLDMVRRAVKLTKAAGIHATGYFMLGMLNETKETIRETIDFARELDLDFHGFSLTTPIPGTELYSSALSQGLVSGDSTSVGEWSLHTNANLTRDCSDSELEAFASETFREFSLQKRFGKYYFINPVFWVAELKVLASLRNMEQARELFGKATGLLKSYFKKTRK
jgi:radical SAM superfamily enzyme YgiQ (UPF0313 family)